MTQAKRARKLGKAGGTEDSIPSSRAAREASSSRRPGVPGETEAARSGEASSPARHLLAQEAGWSGEALPSVRHSPAAKRAPHANMDSDAPALGFSNSPTEHPAAPGGPLHKLLSGGSPSGSKPRVIEHALAVPLEGKPAAWMAALSDLGFTSAQVRSDSLELELVQSNDLFGHAHEFIRLSLSRKGLALAYTVLPSQNPARRKLEAARLSLLVLGATRSPSSPPELLSFMAECLDGALANLSLASERLLSRNTELEERVRELDGALKSMASGRESDARKMLADTQAILSLQSRLDALLSLSDRSLDEEVMEWLRSHDGVVSARELGRHLSVPSSRVEASLDRLCKDGLIAKVGK